MNDCCFKVGDLVKYIDNNWAEVQLKVNGVYVVKRVFKSNGDWLVDFSNSSCCNSGWWPGRFVIVKRTKLSELLYL
jgi:hypothetical protein